MSRVVVTGMGLLTPLGLDVLSTWEALCQGISGITTITGCDTSQLRVHIGAEVKHFDPLCYMDRKEVRRTDPFEHFVVAAARQALAQSRLQITAANAADIGVYIGSGIGGLTAFWEGFNTIVDRGPERVSPFSINMMSISGAPGLVSIMTGAMGPNWSTVSACATSSNAIGEAWETIRRGDARAMIAGGAEKSMIPIALAAFDAMRALSHRNDDPQSASRPFDAMRDGFVLGEGAAMLVLEDLDFARERGATILAEMIGYGSTSDAHHITEPSPSGLGLAKAMQRALRKAGLYPQQVDYINAHGTSTLYNDRMETLSIKSCFGEYAYQVPISSVKSMLGHMMGATGAAEAIVCIMTILTGIITPTINLQHPDPECDLDYVPNKARNADVSVALSNSMGFGGHNACLIFKRFEG